MDAHPLLTAEQIGVSALEKLETHCYRGEEWQRLEVAFAKGPYRGIDRDLDHIEEAFDAKLNSQHSVADVYRSRFILAGFNLYRQRAKREEYSQDELRKYNHKVGTITRNARRNMIAAQSAPFALEISDKPNVGLLRGVVGEGIAMYLLTRQGRVALPASPREESSQSRAYNHDIAVMYHDQKKAASVKYRGRDRLTAPEVLSVRVAQHLGRAAVKRIERMPRKKVKNTVLERFLHDGVDMSRAISRLIDDDIGHHTLHEKDGRAILLNYLGVQITRNLNDCPLFVP